MIKSLTKMFNLIREKEEIPTQWQKMNIKSIHKKGSKEDLNNKRGLFLTNIISKTFEKLLDKKCNVKYDELQHGGCKGRSTVDNWIIMMAVIDEGRRLKKSVYLFFADLVKCFDRLWLKDCIVDLHEAGVREREARMIFKLNEEATFRVITPAGVTNEIKVNEIVKQGTIFGPKLCCASTGKVNNGITKSTVVFPSISIKAATFVDDIGAFGTKELIENTMKRCQEMEREKMMEFSTEKSKWMCIANRRRNEEQQNVEGAVKQGKLERTHTYKYLGNYINEKGNMDDQLKHMEKKVNDVIREGNRLCASTKVGKMELEAKLLV